MPDCDLGALRREQGDLNRLPTRLVREAIFECAGVVAAISSLDELDRDLLFLRAREFTLADYLAKETETAPPVAYGSLMSRDKLARLWQLLRDFYSEQPLECYGEKLQSELGREHLFRFGEEVSFDPGLRLLTIGDHSIPLAGIDPERSTITTVHDPVRDDDCPTTFCTYRFQVRLYLQGTAATARPDYELVLPVSIGVGRVGLGYIALREASMALNNLFSRWPRECFGARP